MAAEGLNLAASLCPSGEPDTDNHGSPTEPSASIHLCECCFVATASVLLLKHHASYLGGLP